MICSRIRERLGFCCVAIHSVGIHRTTVLITTHCLNPALPVSADPASWEIRNSVHGAESLPVPAYVRTERNGRPAGIPPHWRSPETFPKPGRRDEPRDKYTRPRIVQTRCRQCRTPAEFAPEWWGADRMEAATRDSARRPPTRRACL